VSGIGDRADVLGAVGSRDEQRTGRRSMRRDRRHAANRTAGERDGRRVGRVLGDVGDRVIHQPGGSGCSRRQLGHREIGPGEGDRIGISRW